ncbi:MAG: methyltransferase domain-containing protein [Acidobacteriota bacterium]
MGDLIPDERFGRWLSSLEARHLADLTFPEVSRALRALSATYVERRQRLAEGAALAGAGKRAAFALFYGPLHYLLIRRIVTALPGAGAAGPAGAGRHPWTLVDLGCGTGAAGAGWAAGCDPPPSIVGIDRHPWALAEAAETYRAFGWPARTRQGDVAGVQLPGSPAALLAAFTVNELAASARDRLLRRLIGRAREGDRVLVVEPLAGFVAPWWKDWRQAFQAAGGRDDEWRFRVELPAIVAKLDRAAGLNHRELKARSLWLPGT